MKNYCEKCGNELAEGAVFCTNCGNEINSEEIKERAEVSEEIPQIESGAQSVFCTNCGEAINPIADFCVKCGVLKNRIKNYCAHCGNKLSQKFSVGAFKLSAETQEKIEKFAQTRLGRAYFSYWKNWKDYQGRAARPDYWFAYLASAIIGAFLGILTIILNQVPLLNILFVLLLVGFGVINIVPAISINVRRANDAGLNWKWYLLAIFLAATFFLAILPTQNKEK